LVHTRFCSTHCELIYEQERKKAAVTSRWVAFLARDKSAS
jgi:predicted nucleic acid-binding Zn ribbon protein